MCRCLFVILCVAVSVGHAANIPEEYGKFNPDASCIETIKMLFRERNNCIHTFMKHLVQNDIKESDKNCTDLDVMEMNFSVRLHANRNCWNQEVITSMKTRLTMLRRLLNATKVHYNEYFKDFFSDGFKCIYKSKENIQNKCITETMKSELVFTDNLSRVSPFLYYGTRSCSKNSLITKCAMNIINKECPTSKALDFVPYLQNIIINGQCNNTKNVTSSPFQGKAGSSAGTIIGILLGIVALIILGLFAMRKYKKMSMQQTESHRVSYRHQPKEK